jgi:hypothetical protein
VQQHISLVTLLPCRPRFSLHRSIDLEWSYPLTSEECSPPELMSRPRPLSNVSTAPYNADQQLTPRTPHSGSRTSRLEQGFSKVHLTDRDDGDLDDLNTLQSAPLLASSSTARFSVRDGRSRLTTGAGASSKEGRRRKTFLHPTQIFTVIANQLPLAFGTFMAGVLLILVVISYYRPEALHRYIGVRPPVTANATTGAAASTKNLSDSASTPKPVLIQPPAGVQLISYENYTSFPLRGQEYLEECHKLHSGYMAHADYWDVSPMTAYDVPHLDDKSICSSTITYMLDGTVGLTADLALMAQVAALAAEVCAFPFDQCIRTSRRDVAEPDISSRGYTLGSRKVCRYQVGFIYLTLTDFAS